MDFESSANTDSINQERSDPILETNKDFESLRKLLRTRSSLYQKIIGAEFTHYYIHTYLHCVYSDPLEPWTLEQRYQHLHWK